MRPKTITLIRADAGGHQASDREPVVHASEVGAMRSAHGENGTTSETPRYDDAVPRVKRPMAISYQRVAHNALRNSFQVILPAGSRVPVC